MKIYVSCREYQFRSFPAKTGRLSVNNFTNAEYPCGNDFDAILNDGSRELDSESIAAICRL